MSPHSKKNLSELNTTGIIGFFVGGLVGNLVGYLVGNLVGLSVGCGVGIGVGLSVGLGEGPSVVGYSYVISNVRITKLGGKLQR